MRGSLFVTPGWADEGPSDGANVEGSRAATEVSASEASDLPAEVEDGAIEVSSELEA